MEQDSKIWLDKAEEDFDIARFNIEGGKIEAGIFFLQQSVEKALKALHIKQQGKLLRSHDLLLLSKTVNAPPEIQKYCKELSPAYYYTRYPDAKVQEDIGIISESFVESTEDILKWVKTKLYSKN
ncbi:MAG: HEPN domain-containing protein [archaeon]